MVLACAQAAACFWDMVVVEFGKQVLHKFALLELGEQVLRQLAACAAAYSAMCCC